jgi:hypothetical protein
MAAVNARDEKVARWSTLVESFPETLRAGPYVVLGRALAHRGQSALAALAALAESLWDAATMLEKLDQGQEAIRLYQELALGYGQERAGASARARLDELKVDVASAVETISPVGDTLDERFLDGLRQRRLFELAGTWCDSQLDRLEPADARRVDITIERSRNHAEHALQSPPGARDELWQKALGVLADFSRHEPECPRLVLIQELPAGQSRPDQLAEAGGRAADTVGPYRRS